MPSKYLITKANIITFSGILAIALSIWTGYADYKSWSLMLYLWSALSDFLDGLVARWDEERGGRGVSEFGQILDPIRDKLIIARLFPINWQLALMVAVLEVASFIFALQIKQKTGRHFITLTSKRMTAVQFIVIGAMIILPEKTWLFTLIYVATLIRVVSYGIELKNINRFISKNR